LKLVSCGAAPLLGKTIQDFVEVLPHVDFIQVYGSKFERLLRLEA
jgi:4-coumarate--CoA ligase